MSSWLPSSILGPKESWDRESNAWYLTKAGQALSLLNTNSSPELQHQTRPLWVQDGTEPKQDHPESCENTEQELVQTTKITQRPWVLGLLEWLASSTTPAWSLVFSPLLCKVTKTPHQDSTLLPDSTQSRAMPSFLQRSPENSSQAPLLHVVLPEPSLCAARDPHASYSTPGCCYGWAGEVVVGGRLWQ